MMRNDLPPFHLRLKEIVLAIFILASVCLSALGQELKKFDAAYLRSPAGGPKLDAAAGGIIRATNELRVQQHLAPLKTNAMLTRAAEYFAAFMARTNTFSHEADGNRPADRVSLFGYEYCIVAENIAYRFNSRGFTTEELSRSMFESWKTSPPHLKNMLDPDLAEVGVAIGHDPRSGRYYAVQDFGRPESAMIHFQVTNHTGDTLYYTVTAIGREQAPAKRFDLEPRMTMNHSRCRPAKLDWGWTESDDNVKVKHGRAYVITKKRSGYQVAEQAVSE